MPNFPNSLEAGACCSESDQTAAPKRRGSCRRKTPWVVTKSMWSCLPASACERAKFKLPDMPKCSIKIPRSMSSKRYLPRRRTPITLCPTKREGETPKGHLKGLPMCKAKTRAPAIRLAKLSLVTSTSGNSGMGTLQIRGEIGELALFSPSPWIMMAS